ncbi:NAD-dependent epimerase/dehydratase family protein [Pseudobacteriovorax antillogorgiicola]|uniref:Nucleoside-diphosphate-sugar epimerase n=1 Tax=Pseudobacteriovorax antillogorgiicola TaxID=1513793 RepID=A0A1Y6CLA8_9BACT|nr:NAD(P)-dependent oxidoreductase [Pseudobacteriovorax antillogorgiicola]TCS45231.1 nucleoside-diphosphate-sugar epimerase [Pseudobacteriovorax antillogorgiicola]SMF75344.1 Nucleoside-diphosphate-sugar epimerase [Pseudobacteriovorax antillogorgiicola]
MTKLLSIGLTGFIGTNFLRSYVNNFEKIHILTRHSRPQVLAPNIDASTLDEVASINDEFDWGLYMAHDHTDLYANIDLFRSFLQVCERLSVKRLIVLSSFVVYDFLHEERISINSSYIKIGEPYIQVKQKLEFIAERYSLEKDAQVYVLQPAVVLGEGGAWDRLIRSLSECHKIGLYGNGSYRCNWVHVEQVSEKIIDIIISQSASTDTDKFKKYIVSNGSTDETWKDLLVVGGELEKIESPNNRRYHNNMMMNLALIIIFAIPSLRIKSYILKKVRAKGSNSKFPSIWFPIGLTRIVMSRNYSLN